MDDTARLDRLNIALMLAALGVAYVIPFKLLLLSYAFLGPAHYLTQISWMHDRKYFTGSRAGPWLLMLLAFLPALFPKLTHAALSAALAGTIVMVIPAKKPYMRPLLFAAVYVLYLFVQHYSVPLRVMVAYALPTTIHIFVFTGLFMLYGALKRPGFSANAALVFFIACPALLFAFPPGARMAFENGPAGDLSFFRQQFAMLMEFLRVPDTPAGHAALFGFLSWAYTYHYLNWFSKTRLIGWHEISRRRAGVIVALYAAAVALYLYDFGAGLTVLFALSLLHVLLELPLDLRTMHGIGREIRARLRSA